MRLRLVNPVKSMIASIHARGRQNPKFRNTKAGMVTDPHGIGCPLIGEPGRNKTGKGGFGDNPTMKQIRNRYLGSKATQFKPGNCASPYGRKGYKGAGVEKMKREKISKRSEESISIVKEAREVQELARTHAPVAIKAVSDILSNDVSSDMAKIAAAHLLLDRGYGKSTQTNVNVNPDADAKPSQVDGKELDRRINEALERIEGATKRTREKIAVQERPTDLRKLN